MENVMFVLTKTTAKNDSIPAGEYTGTTYTIQYWDLKSESWEFYRDLRNAQSSELEARVEKENLPKRKAYPNGSFYPAGDVFKTISRCIELGIPREQIQHKSALSMEAWRAIQENPEVVKAALAG